MANVAHSSLTGSSLHEPKGVAAASANTVYAADGAGSGAWTDVNTLLTATNFTTGDCKLTIKTIADSGWVLMNDSSIGSALSPATFASSTAENLFKLIWNNISDTWAPVHTGRGASANADWSANKAIFLPRVLGRALIGAGAGTGLTSRTLGSFGGAENHTLIGAELPSHNHAGTTDTENVSHTHSVIGTTGAESNDHTHGYVDVGDSSAAAVQTGLGTNVAPFASAAKNTSGASATHTHNLAITSGTQSVTHTHTFTTSNFGSGSEHNNMQPWLALNVMIKL